ncbi:MAG: sulfatase [Planctomycetota bacterium]
MRCPQVKSKLPQGSLAFTVLAILVVGQCNPTQATERPNILWITAEDLSPALGCYGDPDANTPNIDALASRSTKFTHAFANSPVCSTARSCLITGRYATSLGTMHMRSAFPIPADFVGFPALMRDAGYYTSNNVKTDYNIRNPGPFIHECWNESSAQAHWRKRPNQDTPFFAVFNLMESHQSRSMVWPREKFLAEIQIQLSQDQIHAPDSMHLPPYYVDTPIVRQEWARFYDCVSVMDQKVGKLLTQLEDDGLSENTIIFFFGDHGTGMPRHKRALLNTGIHIPLIVHIPNSMRKYAAQIQESETNRLVSFVDFAPTVLEMALIGVPKYMQGVSFAGQSDLRKNAVYAYRDRVDEARDLSRAVRKQDYLYIRNYMPHLGYNQPTAWPDQGALRHEFYEAAEKINSGSSSLTAAQKHFLAPARPFEELYDCRADPQNLRNLAGETQFQRRLDELRRELDELLVTSGDRGFIPEAKLMAIMDEPNAAIDSAAKRFREAAEQAWGNGGRR